MSFSSAPTTKLLLFFYRHRGDAGADHIHILVFPTVASALAVTITEELFDSWNPMMARAAWISLRL